VETSRELIGDSGFKRRHRWAVTAFTRASPLSFDRVLVMVLRKSVKSLQNVANEAMRWLECKAVSASAYSQARYKLKHTAFIELNEKAVVGTMYADRQFHTWRGFRLLAVDGSKLLLPDSADVEAAFGTIRYTNGQNAECLGERPYALASVLYDVLNRVALDATLGRADAYEVDLAVGHLKHTRADDLLVMDRNYPSYRMLAELTRSGRDFVVRCSGASFGAARQMLKGEGAHSRIVTLSPCAGQAAAIRNRGLPGALPVRFVRVRLSTGEWEVLVTSLRDEVRYRTEEFLELYGLRWGIESFYGLLKTRLELENFTGTGAEAVRQDFYATVYLSGLESILTATAQSELDAKEVRHRQLVNRAVSFNAIKNEALELLLGRQQTGPLLAQLTDLFLKNPTLVRKGRNPPRKKTSSRVSLNFHKREKKHCF
jgi:hypothetical protein